jgi:type IV pilus assembly protein PilA
LYIFNSLGERLMKKQIQKGFTLIELIALPAYQTYMIKARVSEGILAASQCRTAIAEVYQTGNADTAPGVNGWGCEESVGPLTQFVQTVTTSADGVITVTLTVDDGLGELVATGGASGGTIILTPQLSTGVAMTVAANMTEQVNRFDCDPGTVPDEYLPGSCKVEA